MSYERERVGDIAAELKATNLKEVIERRCALQPSKVAFNFLHEGELDGQEPISYADLDAYSRAILFAAREYCGKGDRALLLFPPGNAFVATFVACLYGGIIAVPAAMPGDRDQDWARLGAILDNCQPKVILSCGAFARRAERRLKQSGLAWRGAVLDVAEIPMSQGAGVATSDIRGDDLAFLQYTSGSTGNPKGVMVTHDNLLHNERLIQEGFRNGTDTRLVSWLPMFHDMGLIGGALHALFLGAQLSYMAPEAFLQSPLRWLRAVSHFRATYSGAPNFAYDLCVARYNAEDCKALDLSHWRVAFNGAEPVRAATMERFQRTFAPHGLAPTALAPAYGLAEAVLMVSTRANRTPKIVRASAESFARGVVAPATNGEAAKSDEAGVSLISVGNVAGDQHVLLVDPRTRVPVERHRMGEVWLSGPSVTRGYWEQEDATRETFRVRPVGVDSDREYLRTGDMGYFDDAGELYITGRIKDTVIINGKNYFPQDLECVVEAVDKSLRPGGSAIFSIDHEGQERLVVLQEVRSADRGDLDTAALIKAIRAKVASEFQLNVFDVCLLKPRALLKTTSGKIQRQRNKQAYLSGDLNPLAQHRTVARNADERAAPTATPGPSSDAVFRLVREWIKTTLGAESYVAPDDLFVDAGMTSVHAVSLAAHLGKQLGQNVDVTLIWSFPEVFRFCEALAERLQSRPEAAPEPEKRVESRTSVDELDDEALRELIRKELAE